MLTSERWHDQSALRWTMHDMSLLILQQAGPRIVGLQHRAAPNMLAEVPEFTIPHPAGEPFSIWGGHRLWYAPEVPATTYLPDNQPVAISETDNTLTIRGVPAADGIQKTLILTVDADNTITIDHVLTNYNDQPIACAPWAITQFKTGGMAILPQTDQQVDAAGLQANRGLALWQYTDVTHTNLSIGNRWITVHASYAPHEAMKIGWVNRVGWLAYHWRGQLFTKWAAFDPEGWYYDNNSSSECYCNNSFLELETLAPRTVLQPNARVRHREIWRVQELTLRDYNEATLDQVFAALPTPLGLSD